MAEAKVNRSYVLADGSPITNLNAVEAGETVAAVVFSDAQGAGEPVVCTIADLPAAMSSITVAHGLNAKVGDAASGASWDERRESIAAVWASLCAGEWRRPGSGAPSGPRISDEDLVGILIRLGNAKAKAAKKVADPETAATLRKNDVVKTEFSKLRAERNPDSITKAQTELEDLLA